jgi:hypothetical protein
VRKTDEEIRAEIDKLYKAWGNPHISHESINRISYAISALKWTLGDYNGEALTGVFGIGGQHG